MPQNTQPSYHCAVNLALGVAQTGLDALGVIPGEGSLKAAFNIGAAALGRTQLGAGLVSFVISKINHDTPGKAFGGAGIALVAGDLSQAGSLKNYAEAIPVAGQAVAAVATVYDTINTIHEAVGCYYSH